MHSANQQSESYRTKQENKRVLRFGAVAGAGAAEVVDGGRRVQVGGRRVAARRGRRRRGQCHGIGQLEPAPQLVLAALVAEVELARAAVHVGARERVPRRAEVALRAGKGKYGMLDYTCTRPVTLL